MDGRIIDLASVEHALTSLQDDLSRVNHTLGIALEPLDHRVIGNMVSGYALIDQWAAAGLDLLALGNSAHLLELNARVLCGLDPRDREAHARHFDLTRERFYDHRRGGIARVAEWYKRNQGLDVWNRAAGLFLMVAGEPQLFVEGNHRTGVLLINAILLGEGLPPFVLCPANAVDFFSITVGIDRRWLARLSRWAGLPQARHALAAMLVRVSGTGLCHLRAPARRGHPPGPAPSSAAAHGSPSP